MDRSKTMQAVSKVLAYLACGNRAKARDWAGILVDMLRAEGLV